MDYHNGEYDYDTLTLQQWKRRQESPPLNGSRVERSTHPKSAHPDTVASPSVGRPAKASDGARLPEEDVFSRSCEWCGAGIVFDADPRRRYCSASCRAKAAKRRKPPVSQGLATANDAGSAVVGSGSNQGTGANGRDSVAIDLADVNKVVSSLLACSNVGEVEIRVFNVSVVVRR